MLEFFGKFLNSFGDMFVSLLQVYFIWNRFFESIVFLHMADGQEVLACEIRCIGSLILIHFKLVLIIL